MDITQQAIQAYYEQSYKEARDGTPDNEVAIGISAGGNEKVFVEKNFYFCGFNSLVYGCTTKLNRQLHKAVKGNKNYGGGFRIMLNSIGQHGNGDFTIQEQAYSKTANWLQKQGFEVYAESRLD